MNDAIYQNSNSANPDSIDSERFAALGANGLLARRRLLIATSAIGAAGVVGSVIPFLESMEPSARAKAEGGPADVDIGTLIPGELRTVVWRGKPVWLLKRDARMLSSLGSDSVMLADPDSAHSVQPGGCRNPYRSLQPDLAVIVGVCTHLGCSPVMRGVSAAESGSLGDDWPGGFYCPCHGSKFDFAGRVFKNVPAPINLDIPPYQYLSSTRVRIGEEGIL